MHKPKERSHFSSLPFLHSLFFCKIVNSTHGTARHATVQLDGGGPFIRQECGQKIYIDRTRCLGVPSFLSSVRMMMDLPWLACFAYLSRLSHSISSLSTFSHSCLKFQVGQGTFLPFFRLSLKPGPSSQQQSTKSRRKSIRNKGISSRSALSSSTPHFIHSSSGTNEERNTLPSPSSYHETEQTGKIRRKQLAITTRKSSLPKGPPALQSSSPPARPVKSVSPE